MYAVKEPPSFVPPPGRRRGAATAAKAALAASTLAFRGAGQLWSSWPELARWEDRAEEEFGPQLADLIVVLWSLHRLGATAEGIALLQQITDAEADGESVDPVLQDILDMSFALGAAWATSQATEGEAD